MPLRRAQARRARGIVLRLAALLGAVALPAAAVLRPAEPARAALDAPRAAPVQPPPKAEARLPRWQGPLAPAAAEAPPERQDFALLAVPGEGAGSFELAPETSAAFGPGRPVAPVWQEAAIAGASALDGRTLRAGTRRLRLAGLALPAADALCPTLDGRQESCRTRAATVLDLTLRHRNLACRFTEAAPDEAVGTCRIGGGDLGERLLKAGYAVREG